MNLTIISGGQTGVDRGAHLGALDVALPIKGYMPKNCCDELGPIPADIAKYYYRCTTGDIGGGLAARTYANVEFAHALLIVVDNADKPDVTPGTRLTMKRAKERKLPILPVDSRVFVADRDIVFEWLIDMTEIYDDAPSPELRLMVAGPRASRWAGGEDVARNWVRTLVGD